MSDELTNLIALAREDRTGLNGRESAFSPHWVRRLCDLVEERENGVLGEIRREREHQDEKWGGPAHDIQHTDEDWCGYILPRIRPDSDRHELIEAAALIVAMIESNDICSRVGI